MNLLVNHINSEEEEYEALISAMKGEKSKAFASRENLTLALTSEEVFKKLFSTNDDEERSAILHYLHYYHNSENVLSLGERRSPTADILRDFDSFQTKCLNSTDSTFAMLCEVDAFTKTRRIKKKSMNEVQALFEFKLAVTFMAKLMAVADWWTVRNSKNPLCAGGRMRGIVDLASSLEHSTGKNDYTRKSSERTRRELLVREIMPEKNKKEQESSPSNSSAGDFHHLHTDSENDSDDTSMNSGTSTVPPSAVVKPRRPHATKTKRSAEQPLNPVPAKRRKPVINALVSISGDDEDQPVPRALEVGTPQDQFYQAACSVCSSIDTTPAGSPLNAPSGAFLDFNEYPAADEDLFDFSDLNEEDWEKLQRYAN
jgi:hypothetical protein